MVFTSHSVGKVSKDGRIPSISTLQLFGATVGSEHWSCFTFSYLSAPAASDMSLKPHLGGSSVSQIELVLTLLHTSHNFASRNSSGSTVFIPG